MKTVKTKAGTELPLRDMQGRDYLDVQYRVLWMREEHPDWTIETEFLELSPDTAIAKATVKDANGRIIAQGSKRETAQSFKRGFIEKSETGAIGRALGFVGYGTQFALDLDEDEEGHLVVDSPVPPREQKPPVNDRTTGGLTHAQIKRLDAIAAKVGIPNANLREIASGLGIKSRDEMNKTEYEKLVALVEAWRK